jgi:DNA-binding response OmpR family regulator
MMSEPARTPLLLVVEDEPDVLQLIVRTLRSAGNRVVGTSDPAAAAALAHGEPPDLVLLDLAMPGRDGYAVLQDLQADPATAACPVMFLTASADFEERVRAFRFGVVDYMTKPFSPQALQERVARVLAELDGRPGRVGGVRDAAAFEELLARLKQERRTGVLRISSRGGDVQLLVRAGEPEGTPPQLASGAEVVFEDLDPHRDAVVGPDPPRLPGEVEPPRLEAPELPEALRTVLVVDDNELFRGFLRTLLSGHGFTVHEAANGEEALAVALEQRPWLVLADLRMPGMDGVEFCRRLRAHSLLRHVPFVFLSGWDDYRDRYRGLEAGADEFLPKTTPGRELLIRLHLLLRRFASVGGRGAAGESALQGRLDLVGAAGVLQILHTSRLTGVLTVRSGTQQTTVTFRDGEVIAVQGEGATGERALVGLLGWTRGSYEFTPSEPATGTPLGESFSQLLLEACRVLDETGRA